MDDQEIFLKHDDIVGKYDITHFLEYASLLNAFKTFIRKYDIIDNLPDIKAAIMPFTLPPFQSKWCESVQHNAYAIALQNYS